MINNMSNQASMNNWSTVAGWFFLTDLKRDKREKQALLKFHKVRNIRVSSLLHWRVQCDSSSARIYFRKEAFRIAIYGICYSGSNILLL